MLLKNWEADCLQYTYFFLTCSMANLSVFQSTRSCGAHNQAAFNWLSSCFLLNSISWQKTKQLLHCTTAKKQAEVDHWQSQFQYREVWESLSATKWIHLHWKLHTAATQLHDWHLVSKSRETVTVLAYMTQTSRERAEGGGNICFLHFLVAQLLCSSIFTVLKARQFHLL